MNIDFCFQWIFYFFINLITLIILKKVLASPSHLAWEGRQKPFQRLNPGIVKQKNQKHINKNIKEISMRLSGKVVYLA